MNRHEFLFSSRRGFTVLELLLFSVMFSIVTIAFLTIFVSITNVEVRQNVATEVASQSQFLLSQIQFYVERSSLIDMTKDAPASILKLRMPNAAEDPTYISLVGNTVYLQKTDVGTPQPLTSGRVSVTNITFTKHSNAPSHDSVSVSFVVAYNTANPKQQFSEALNTAIARVSAATFDSNVVPVTSATYDLGAISQIWRSVNNLIYFNGSNVGVGVSLPNAKFQVSGGDVYVDTTSKGLVLRSSDGACWRISPSITGALTTASIICP